MGEDNRAVVLPLVPNRKTILRLARREMLKMYQISGGGRNPIVCEASREMFERGEIDEVRWLDWGQFCRTLPDVE